MGKEALFLTIGFETLKPAGIDDLLGKARQFGEELMGCSGEHCLGQVFVGDPHHVTRIVGGEVEDRLREANEDVLRLARNQSLAQQFPSFSLAWASSRNAWARNLEFRTSR